MLTTYLIYALPGFLLLLVYVIYTNLLKNVYLDEYRMHLFNIRDKLFEIARTGSILFESDLYRAMERNINMNIRYAHKLTAMEVLVTYMLIKLGFYSPSTKPFLEIIDEAKAYAGRTNMSLGEIERIEAMHSNVVKLSYEFTKKYSPLLFVGFNIYSKIKRVFGQNESENSSSKTKEKYFEFNADRAETEEHKKDVNRNSTPLVAEM